MIGARVRVGRPRLCGAQPCVVNHIRTLSSRSSRATVIVVTESGRQHGELNGCVGRPAHATTDPPTDPPTHALAHSPTHLPTGPTEPTRDRRQHPTVKQALRLVESLRGRFTVNGVDLYMHSIQAATHAMQHEDGLDRHDAVVAALMVSVVLECTMRRADRAPLTGGVFTYSNSPGSHQNSSMRWRWVARGLLTRAKKPRHSSRYLVGAVVVEV